MKQRLQKIYWTGIILTLVMAFIATGALVATKMTDTRNQMTALLKASSGWTLDSGADLQSLADSIAEVSPGLRVTFLLDTGLIIADSKKDDHPEESHINDPEIIAAREGKIIDRLGMSSDRTDMVLFMAKRVSPQLLLRLSYPVFEITKALLFYGILLLAFFLILYLLQRAAITRYARDIQKQFEDIRVLLDEKIIPSGAVFPELQPYIDEIAYRVRRLWEDEEKILATMNLRSDFVANASHELKSPLTSIMGFAEMLDENLAETEEERQLCVRTIREQCTRMLEVIDDILLLRKTEKKDILPDVPAIAAAPVAGEVVRALAPQAAARKIELKTQGDLQIRMEERDLWETLFNLSDNAIRYGREGGSVVIRMEQGRIEVEDNGIGMKEDHVKHIFEPFYRVDETRDNKMGGTGLGLSIVAAIVKNYGGTITVLSRPDEGSCFTMTFPEES